MPKSRKKYPLAQPMRIQALQGSLAEKRYYDKSALPGGAWPSPKAIAPGVSPAPLSDLMFHGGKIVPKMEFQNIYLGSSGDFAAGDIDSIDAAITRAMRDNRLNNVMVQYFSGAPLTCDPRPSVVLEEVKPKRLDEPDVQAEIVALFDNGTIADRDLDTAIFNLVLPPGTELKLDSSSSLRGLGGYHGSVHFNRGSRRRTLYYSANVYSERRPNGGQNGIVVFNKPWKNLVATLYHELCEFRTDPDVGDAIRTGNNDFLGWTSRFGREIGDQPIAAASSLALVFKEILTKPGQKRTPVQFMYSNAVHGAEGPIAKPHS
jgi:hypothetical protein